MQPEKRSRILQTVEISKSYSGRKVVDNVSVRVEQGEVVGLLGPNGAGKTTSFHTIVGLISPDSGEVLLDDQRITQLPMYQRAHRGISYLPQEASVFRKLTRGRQPDGDSADAAVERARAAGAHVQPDRRSGLGDGTPQQGIYAVGRRAATCGNCSLPGVAARLYFVG